ncbi:hypothetical protein F751_3761 [Auxenochlorella protothecoides]|uniref:Uncharacterized protein n=1 Tax=Auxenochlorella protothecoides TaxID=3075 RepID=A0A087SG95_AUXPR|nr:hypothetical protein F751_3761 [Auxenochlorella protothecoides]KFM24749.1 hypothetical protein F751_3761 [Auxenochlorella protothecoides]RMZ52614.1 hypothetical protein APUTEX25_000733 [Auxenochlorella protothecoides]|eukprot:RMZ52614.1 hypothetical protein APUTEX25_000733 [Auxenochlorella protothecoides]
MQRSTIVSLLFGLNIIAWIILLGGISAWQYNCNKENPDSIVDVCLTAYAQLAWWAVFFQLFTLIFLAVAYYTRRGSNKLGLMVTLAMVTTLFFVVTNNAFTVVKSSSGALRSSTEAFAAGAILTMMANLLIIFVLGDDMSSAVAAQEPYLNSNPASSVQMSGAKPTSSAMV